MKPRLVAVSGSLRGTVRELTDGSVSIGRAVANDFCLTDASASRQHCAVRQVGGEYDLTDLDSQNGTFVNGIPTRHTVLHHGDMIGVGASELLFLVHDGEGDRLDLCLDDEPTVCEVKKVGIEGPALHATPDVDVGRMTRDLVALFRISSIIHTIRDLEGLQREILQLIFEVVPADKGAIVLLAEVEEDRGSICSWSRKAGGGEPISIPRDLMYRALWERSVIYTNDASMGSDIRNMACLPLISAEKALGVLYLTSSEPAAAFCDDHLHFLNSVSQIAAVTLENRLVLNALSSENEQLKEQICTSKLVGDSSQIVRMKEFIRRVAQGDSTVLIRGESGTGKEVVARAIHHQSPRVGKPFVAINCAAIPESLLESELFGHEKGAFTGAAATKKGKLEVAEDGTLFLDEIGELAPVLQAKLLRVLQQREFERVGGTRCLAFTARVLAATNKNLEQAIRTGEFRQDLYYRLNVVSVTVPPLREHCDDIPLLALFFAAKYAARSKRPFRGISLEARRLLMGYSWPGNVRELENAIEHAIVLGLTEEILPEDLPTAIHEEQSAGLEGVRYHAALNQTKRDLILSALREAQGNYPGAARLLGIHPKYLHRLVRNLNLRDRMTDLEAGE